MSEQETHTLCTECGERIPWSKPRVVQFIMKGTDIIDKANLCTECASK